MSGLLVALFKEEKCRARFLLFVVSQTTCTKQKKNKRNFVRQGNQPCVASGRAQIFLVRLVIKFIAANRLTFKLFAYGPCELERCTTHRETLK